VDSRHEFLAVERLGQVIVGAEAEALDLVLGIVGTGQDQDRRRDLGQTKLSQHLVPVHVGKVQVEQDQVVVVELREIDPLFAEIGAIDVQVGMGQHQFDAARGGRIVLHQKNSHRTGLRIHSPDMNHPCPGVVNATLLSH
jgi:hypothetical protein